MCKSKRFMMRTLALIALVSVLVTSAFAFNTYKSFSSVSISGGGGKSVTDTASISAATTSIYGKVAVTLPPCPDIGVV